jgi:hypothetical protein
MSTPSLHFWHAGHSLASMFPPFETLSGGS